MAIVNGEVISASDFIDEGEIPSPQSDAEGKVVKLEDDGKISRKFIKSLKPTIQTFTASGTWTKPAGLSHVEVKVTGAGSGAQAGTTGTARISRQGGNAGGTAIKRIDAGSLGATETVTIGVGSDATINTDGGNTSFGSHCTGNGAPSFSTRNGGTATNGDINITGGMGGGENNGAGGASVYGTSPAFGGGGQSWTAEGASGGANGVVIVTEYYN